MSGIEDLWAILAADSVPSEVARIPTRALEAISAHLMPIAHQRGDETDSQYRHGYLAGQHDLTREIATIIKREMAPAEEMYRQQTGESDSD